MSFLDIQPGEAVRLVIRRDGTYDFHYAHGLDNQRVSECLKQIASQIDSGATIDDTSVT